MQPANTAAFHSLPFIRFRYYVWFTMWFADCVSLKACLCTCLFLRALGCEISFSGHRAYICESELRHLLGFVQHPVSLPFSGVSTYNGKVAKYARKRNLSGKFDRLWMKSIVLPNGSVQATTRIVQLFVCGIFVTLAILIMPF